MRAPYANYIQEIDEHGYEEEEEERNEMSA